MHKEVLGCAETLPWKRPVVKELREKLENFELVPRSENTFFISLPPQNLPTFYLGNQSSL